MSFSFSRAPTPVQQTFGFPPRPIAELWCHNHFFIVLQFPPWFLSPSFAACRVCHVVLWQEFSSGRGRVLRWHAGFPRSPALPPELLLAHRSEQENGATRPPRVCANLGRLCWVSVVLNGNYVKDHVPVSSLKLITSKSELCVRHECTYKDGKMWNIFRISENIFQRRRLGRG